MSRSTSVVTLGLTLRSNFCDFDIEISKSPPGICRAGFYVCRLLNAHALYIFEKLLAVGNGRMSRDFRKTVLK